MYDFNLQSHNDFTEDLKNLLLNQNDSIHFSPVAMVRWLDLIVHLLILLGGHITKNVHARATMTIHNKATRSPVFSSWKH